MLLCVSGLAMWWRRRPSGQLGAPLYQPDFRLTAGVAVIAVVLGIVFPMGGIAIIAFAVIDFLLPKRWKEAGARTATT